jgi:hypothetical protein
MDKYETQDILFKSKYTMITSELVDDVIVMYIYNNSLIDFEQWLLFDSFDISQKQFNEFSDRVSFLLAGYIRKVCSMEAINDRIYEKG